MINLNFNNKELWKMVRIINRALILACEKLDDASEGVLYNGEYLMGSIDLQFAFISMAMDELNEEKGLEND